MPPSFHNPLITRGVDSKLGRFTVTVIEFSISTHVLRHAKNIELQDIRFCCVLKLRLLLWTVNVIEVLFKEILTTFFVRFFHSSNLSSSSSKGIFMKFHLVVISLVFLAVPLTAQDALLPYATGNVTEFLQANKASGLPSIVLYNFNLDSG